MGFITYTQKGGRLLKQKRVGPFEKITVLENNILIVELLFVAAI